MTPVLLLKFYKAYVRPILEYEIKIWSLYLQMDIDLLERVQRRATKLLGALRSLV